MTTAPCPELLALLAGARASPHEDAPRLVLADWLEEHGDGRGELMRCQLERAALPPGDPRQRELDDRLWDLLARHRPAYFAPLRDVASDAAIRRGLLAATVSASDLLAEGPQALAATEAWAWVDAL